MSLETKLPPYNEAILGAAVHEIGEGRQASLRSYLDAVFPTGDFHLPRYAGQVVLAVSTVENDAHPIAFPNRHGATASDRGRHGEIAKHIGKAGVTKASTLFYVGYVWPLQTRNSLPAAVALRSYQTVTEQQLTAMRNITEPGEVFDQHVLFVSSRRGMLSATFRIENGAAHTLTERVMPDDVRQALELR